jgi:hypothetical protein
MKKIMTAALLVGVLALTGCGRAGGGAAAGSDGADDGTTSMTLESQALQALGFETADLEPVDAAVEAGAAATASASPTAQPGHGGKDRPGHHKYKRLRFGFGKRTLHGEMVVQTENGTRTLVVQRGEVTAITATTITVKSTDGYTLTWAYADKLNVFEHRTQVKADDIEVGTQVGVAGYKDGDTPTARVIVVPKKK